MASVGQDLFGSVTANVSHLAMLSMAYWNANPTVKMGLLAFSACLCAYGWIYNFKRARAISDTAPSNIASAAQGYVELTGRSSVQADSMVVSPLSGVKCVWFQYWVYEKYDNEWRLMSEGVSPYTIQISDGTGTCQVDVDGADVIGATRRTSYDGSYKNQELILYGGSDLYVLGEFATVGGAATALNLKDDVNELLTSWKRDKTSLYNRFDLNKDGEIDAREWELARREAVKEVQLQHREIRQSSGVNVMRAPSDNKLYLISTLSPQKLRSRFMLWTFFHLFVLLIVSSYAISIWQSQH